MILAGINYSHITFHQITEGIDKGAIVYSKKFFFPQECKTPADFAKYTQNLSFKCLTEFINNFIKNGDMPKGYPQQECFSTYFPRLNSSIHGCINWTWNSKDLVRFINAFDEPYCGANTRVTGRESKVYIKKVKIIEGECNYHPFQAGIIFRKDNLGIYICSNGGVIHSSSINDNEGNSVINSLSVGDKFYSISDDLEKANSTRSFYTSKGIKD